MAAGGVQMGLGYDAASRIDRLFDPATSVNQLRYAYDGLDRLTATQDGTSLDPVESYTYDATGNRTSFTSNDSLGMPVTQTYTYAPFSHWLTSIDAATRTYDPVGNTLTMNGRTFTYTPAGRLRDVVGGPAAVSYAYNGLGEQVRRYQTASQTGAQDHYVYGEQGHWIGSYDVNGAMKQPIVWLEEYPVGLVNASGLKYIEPDHLGTPRAVIEVARNVAVWKWDAKSEAFGNTLPSENPDGDAFSLVFDMRFPGQRFDAATGMNYNHYRHYDPGTGRYGQSDPIGLESDISTYFYVGGDPLYATDPYGLAVIDIPLPVPYPEVAPWLVTASRFLGPAIAVLSISGDAPQACQDDELCEKAKREARYAYNVLMSKRIPQFQSGGRNGRDANHLETIFQWQTRLQKKLAAVRRNCVPLPVEYAEWSRAAYLNAPGF